MDQLTSEFFSYFSQWTNSDVNSTFIEKTTDYFNFDVANCLDQITETFTLLFHHFIVLLSQLYSGNVREIFDSILINLSDLVNWIDFTDFQLKLLREFSLILLGNTILVLIAWKVYGPRISAKFDFSRGSRRAIEELRVSMSELQLPKEHDFKFK